MSDRTKPIGPSNFEVFEVRGPSSVMSDDVFGRHLIRDRAVREADEHGVGFRVVGHDIQTGPEPTVFSWVAHVVEPDEGNETDADV